MTLNRISIAFFIELLLVLHVYPSIYIRQNQLGYFLNGKKSISVMADEDITGLTWTISDSLEKIVASGNLENPISSDPTFLSTNYNYKIDFSSFSYLGTFTFSVNNENHSLIKISENPIKDVVKDNLRFIKVHRAGISEIEDRKTAHVKDSSCNVMRKRSQDNNKKWYLKTEDENVNMYGGWYDGFSYIKYTLTNAYTTYLLLRAYEENPTLFNDNSSKIPEILKEAQWGLDFLTKTYIGKNDFIIEVGDFSEDHQGVRLPEMDKMNGSRLAYSALSQSHMGITAAALSIGSRIFKSLQEDEAANNYESAARKIFNRAISLKNGTASWVESDYALHKDETVNDDLLLGSIELYILTKDKSFLTHSRNLSLKTKNKYYCSYSMLHLPAQVRAMEFLPKAKTYIEKDIKSFDEYAKQKKNFWSKPIEYSHGSNYSAMAIASSILKYSEISNNEDYSYLSFEIFDFLYGKNNWGKSFIVTDNVSNPVKNVGSQIYILQKKKIPTGAVTSGPCDAESHKAESIWCFFDPRSLPEYQFNTEKVKYFDHSDDLLCNESIIYGVAEAIYFQSLLAKFTQKKELL